MINLINIEKLKITKRDFHFRKMIVAGLAISALGFVSLALSLASFFYLDYAGKRLSAKEEGLDKSEAIAAKNEADKLNTELQVLSSALYQTKPSMALDEALRLRPEGVMIYHLSFEQADFSQKIFKMAILGKADERQALSSYVAKLKESPVFSKVDAPISNFIGGANASFKIGLEGPVLRENP